MRALSALLTLLWVSAVSAEPFPAFYDVTGVAEGDVLNIRQDPSAASPVLGALAPDAAFVEVVRREPDADWGLVRQGESMGWVSLRYMARHPGQDWQAPEAFTCIGTEPFWSLQVEGNVASYSTPDAVSSSIVFDPFAVAPNNLTQFGAMGRRGPAEAPNLSLSVSRSLCSDGMSDILYGLSALLLVRDREESSALAGCCSLR